MARKRVPKYRIQKDRAGDRAFVELDETRVYLGGANSPESVEKYKRVVAEWLANTAVRTPEKRELTVAELFACFWRRRWMRAA